ncbi:hypothetical protein G6F32_017313 [Rhizopus arrhizus]|nr:hypothetical protein G6F32_017313 [Rhizopus arrhizus]
MPRLLGAAAMAKDASGGYSPDVPLEAGDVTVSIAGDHRQGQPLSHAQTTREQAQEVVRLAGEFHQEAERSVTHQEKPAHLS